MIHFDIKLTFEDHVRDIVSRATQRIGILSCSGVSLWTPVLLRCYYAFVSSILEYCSPMWGSDDECHLRLLERQMYSVARLCHDQSFLSLCHRRHVVGLCMLYKVNSNSNQCLFSEHPSASTELRHTRAAATSHPLEFEESMCWTSNFKVFPGGPGSYVEWPSLHVTWHLNFGWVYGSNQPLLAAPSCVFQFFCGVGVCGVEKAMYKEYIFSHWGLCC